MPRKLLWESESQSWRNRLCRVWDCSIAVSPNCEVPGIDISLALSFFHCLRGIVECDWLIVMVLAL
jgi:hypothetical protein